MSKRGLCPVYQGWPPDTEDGRPEGATMAKNKKSEIARCQVCGEEYNVANLVRSQGDVLWKYKYCSAQCYTESFMGRVKANRVMIAVERAKKKLYTPGNWKVKWWENKGYCDGGAYIIANSRSVTQRRGIMMTEYTGEVTWAEDRRRQERECKRIVVRLMLLSVLFCAVGALAGWYVS